MTGPLLVTLAARAGYHLGPPAPPRRDRPGPMSAHRKHEPVPFVDAVEIALNVFVVFLVLLLVLAGAVTAR